MEERASLLRNDALCGHFALTPSMLFFLGMRNEEKAIVTNGQEKEKPQRPPVMIGC